ncbi:MAG: YjgN family protein [Flavobacteriales bacterium]|nr:YjgN family protein [Flavobacteriales bacterium]
MEILDDDRQNEVHDGPALATLESEGYVFDFGKAFEIGWNIFRENMGGFIGFFLVALLIIVVSCITIIGPLLIAMPLFAGFLIVGTKIYRKEAYSFNDFFGGFSRFGPLLGYFLLYMLISMVFVLPMLIPFMNDFSGMMELAENDRYAFQRSINDAIMPTFALSFVVGLFVQVIALFALPLIVIGKLGTTEAIGWAFKIAKKNFWWLLLYAFVASLVAQTGVIACYIGMFFTLPLAELIKLGAYLQVFGSGAKNRD